MATKDARDVVGGMVEARAVKVTNITESTRRYGSKKTKKTISGIVVAVNSYKKPGNDKSSNL
jgi:hypothetical protein